MSRQGKIAVPSDASPSLQKSLRDLEARLIALEKKVGDDGGAITREELDGAVKALRSDVVARTTPPSYLDENDVFRASGPATAIGHVPLPDQSGGTSQVLHEDARWGEVLEGNLVKTSTTSDPSHVYNLLGHLSLLGQFSAGKIWAQDDLTVNGATNIAGALNVTGAVTAGSITGGDPVSQGWIKGGRITAGQSLNSSTTLTNVTNMVFAIAASETWIFFFFPHMNGPAAGDIKFAVTFPASATVRYGVIGVNSLTSARSTNTAGAGLSGGLTDNQLFMPIVSGIVVNSTNAGDVQLQFAQNTSDATNTNIVANSYYLAFRIA